jgi:two-component system cell cycle sensor histidine kinase/response regulator CckA
LKDFAKSPVEIVRGPVRIDAGGHLRVIFMSEIRILHVEDNPHDAELISRQLAGEGFQAKITVAANKADFLEALRHPCDLILCDYSIPGFDGKEALDIVKQQAPDVPFIFLSGTLGEEAAIESLKAGASDYILKDKLGRLLAAVRGALNAARERHQRRQLEEELRHRAILLDLTDDGILVFSTKGEIQFCNEGAERLFGWPCQELRRMPIVGTIFQTAQEWQNVLKTLSDSREWRGELVQKTRPGATIATDSRAKLASRDSILFVARDITEKKNLEKQFLRAQRLESVGALTSGIAHDLNNILTPILLGAQVLPAKVNDPEYDNVLNTIQNCAARAAAVVSQLLTFARGLNTKPGIFRPDVAAGEVLKITQSTVPKNISINLHIPHAISQISADPTQIQQVLMNLVVNARDALLGKPGHILITVERTTITKPPPNAYGVPLFGEHVKFSVKDDGMGLSEETMEHLFQPFYTTKNNKGTGLGLSTGLAIIKAHHGFFTVESEPGRGTDFSFYLPVAKPDSTFDPTMQRGAAPLGKGELVLFVDDEQAICEMAKVILRLHGYRPVVSTSADDALNFFEANQAEIDVLITDMGMPGMNGAELATKILELKPATKVLICSGNLAESRVHETAPPQARFLAKPWTAQEFLATLQKLLHHPK